MKRAASWTLAAIGAATVVGLTGMILATAAATAYVQWGRRVDRR
jgi:predicted PurR-regulated permease PerM